nr:DNA polymerase I [Tissierella sp.]
MDNNKLMIIDGSSLLHRAFYALPLLTTKEGVYTNGVYGFLTMFYKITEEYDPGYICVAFDKKGPTFRHKEYKEYKGTRSKSPSELAQQFPIIRDVLKAMNVVVLEMDEYEADDIAGTLAKMGEAEGLEPILVTGDKDYLQLATDITKVLITVKGISEMDIFDREKIEQVYEITPSQLIDLKGLMGDKSDNIPGVPGIGEKTGLKLIKEYQNIETVYENIDKLGGKKLKENLIENETIAYLSRRLGTIITNVPVEATIKELKTAEPDYEELLKIYEGFEFKSLVAKIPSEYSKVEEVLDFDIEHEDLSQAEFKKLVDLIKTKKKFAFKFLIDDWNYVLDDVLAVAIKVADEKTFYIDLKDCLDEFVGEFKEVFESKDIEKLGYSLKDDLIILFRLGIKIENFSFDPKIAQYLINPSQTEYSINNLSQEYINYYGIDEEALLGKGKKKKSFNDISEDERRDYLAYMMQVSFKLQPIMMELLEEQNMRDLYIEVENPLMEVLAHMEYIGFKIDKEELEMLGERYQKEIASLTAEIYEMAGVEFNINSPKQMGEVLFDHLDLPVIKKTKTGYSTNAEVLEKLQGKHPIIDKVLRYRQIVKLKSTYIDGYINLINPENGRIHSSFNQTITTTGRISSTEPNLQNIPIKTEDGKQIRKAFIAGDDGHTLVDADYSQIELRVLAHISGDDKMKQAFIEGVDIHTKTASEVFHVPLDEVTPGIRNNAKAVNFGIVYGISDYGLSRDLNISRKEAGEYIDNYLNTYKDIKRFMVDIVSEGKENGFVETLLHRRRYIPELQAKNFNVRSFGERIAMNTPIQGTAADIIKVAMVRVYRELKARGLKSKLILQVHDELIIETVKEELDEVKTLMKELMESAISLEIPLKVDIEVGDSWYDTH